jgi:putative heme iron utilization protein
MIYIETQKLINGVVNKGGKVYIGKYGLDPLLPANKLTVYDKSETAITGFGLTLNFNSDVIVNGEAKGIYAKESYSIQFIDADGATYPKDFVNVTLPIDDTISKDWVKSLESTNDNSAIVDTDGEGNYKLTVFSDAGGDVRTDSNNTYNEDTTQTMDNLVSTTAVVDGVDLTSKNVAQDISIESAATAAANAATAASSAASAASTADGKAVAAQGTANTASSKANANESSINTINSRPYVTEQGGSGNKRYRKWSDGRVEAWGTNQDIITTNGVIITLPTTFPSSNYSLLTTYDSNTGGDAAPMIIGARTTTQFVLSRGQTGLTCSFYAISI